MGDGKLGFIAIARTTFDVALAEQVTATARENLQKAGFVLVGPDALVTTLSPGRSGPSTSSVNCASWSPASISILVKPPPLS